MTHSRLVMLGFALVVSAACSDDQGVTAPRTVLDNAPLLQELVGIVELTDEQPARPAMRWTDRLVVLLYANQDALMAAEGREIRARGTFTESGEFAVQSFALADEDEEDPMLRMRGLSRHSATAVRPRRW